MAEITIWKAGRKMADAPEVQSLVVGPRDDLPGIKNAHLHYFPKVNMLPAVLFEHLAGRALMAFLDESNLVVRFEGEEQFYPDLRYVHGRSEVMKGQPSVTAVLLAQIKLGEKRPLALPELVALQPKLWKIYLEQHGPSIENA